ncbi:hypothetical protein HK102_003002 [Quaeritorhiza haematococci]|nr:hypothetical protein HK102_003002 [Quaeritorhiza haematococci]
MRDKVWEEHLSEKQKVPYYYNVKTGQSVWKKPEGVQIYPKGTFAHHHHQPASSSRGSASQQVQKPQPQSQPSHQHHQYQQQLPAQVPAHGHPVAVTIEPELTSQYPPRASSTGSSSSSSVRSSSYDTSGFQSQSNVRVSPPAVKTEYASRAGSATSTGTASLFAPYEPNPRISPPTVKTESPPLGTPQPQGRQDSRYSLSSSSGSSIAGSSSLSLRSRSTSWETSPTHQRPQHQGQTTLAKRPQYSQLGTPVTIYVNFFKIDLSKLERLTKEIHQYQVIVDPIGTLEVRFKAFGQLLDQNPELKDGRPIFDGRSVIYSVSRLRLKNGSAGIYKISVPGEKRNYTFTVTSNDTAIPLEILHHVRRLRQPLSEKLEVDLSLLQHAFNVLFNQYPSTFMTQVGRGFYNVLQRRQQTQNLGDGVEALSGFKFSVKGCREDVYLNINTAITAFHRAVPLLEYLHELTKTTPDRWTRHDYDKANRDLKGVMVEMHYRGDQKRRYRVGSFSQDTAKTWNFPWTSPDQEGPEEQINVEEYFYRMYAIQLRFPNYPLVERKMGNNKKKIFLPMELCTIVGGQRYTRRLGPNQTQGMIKVANTPPQKRFDDINTGLHEMIVSRNNVPAQSWGIDVSNNMAQVKARILPTPTIAYNPRGRNTQQMARNGRWNLRDCEFWKGATIRWWAIISFVSENPAVQNQLVGFAGKMVNAMRKQGMTVLMDHPPIRFASPEGDVFKALMDAFQVAVGGIGNADAQTKQEQACSSTGDDGKRIVKPDVIFCVLPSTDANLYNAIKRVADTEIGIVTQCVQFKQVKNVKDQYCSNVLSKVNGKLGGINHIIKDSLKWISDRPTIVFGADVSHPGAAERQKPSLAAVVATHDILCADYMHRFGIQRPRENGKSPQDTIVDLSKMTQELLQEFYKRNKGTKPERILFYRDGVSDGQFKNVLVEEVRAIKRACERIQAGWSPPITFICVQKRHQTRFMSQRHDNVSPGTVVDDTITHPWLWDFYLNSHQAIQGTSKPPHYCVLIDENNFSADLLHEVTYQLCHTYARSTTSVSIPAPVYHSHLLSNRIRICYMDADAHGFSEAGSMASRGSRGSEGDVERVEREFENASRVLQVKPWVGQHMFWL